MRFYMLAILLVATLVCPACDGQNGGGGFANSMPSISTFEARESGGIFTHDLYYKYTGTDELTDVDFSLTVYYENGEKPVVKQYWASWKPSEDKIVNVSTGGGKIQREDLAGTALRKGVKVKIDATFRTKG